MDTITRENNIKQAKLDPVSWLKQLIAAGTIPTDLLGGSLAMAAALGVVGGAGAGVVSSKIKEKNPELVSLDRQKKFYDRKIEEMANENWLNDLMATRKKLESKHLQGDERKELEQKYRELIDR